MLSLIRWSRKAWHKITIFAIHSPFRLTPFFRRDREKGIIKVVILSHAFQDHRSSKGQQKYRKTYCYPIKERNFRKAISIERAIKESSKELLPKMKQKLFLILVPPILFSPTVVYVFDISSSPFKLLTIQSFKFPILRKHY